MWTRLAQPCDQCCAEHHPLPVNHYSKSKGPTKPQILALPQVVRAVVCNEVCYESSTHWLDMRALQLRQDVETQCWELLTAYTDVSGQATYRYVVKFGSWAHPGQYLK